MNSKEAYLALHLLDHVGPVRLRRLLEVFGRPEAILAASMSQLRQVHGLGEETARSICDWENRVDLVGELQRIQQHPCQWITLEDANYPQALREIYDPPAVLYVQGSIEPCDHLGLAMVGSRRASAYGLESARRLAIQMARAQVSVISGGARGVDGASHQGAMQAGGRTLAVLGSGLDCLYPRQHVGLFHRIAEHGALITSFPFGRHATRQSFPMRNRIVAGMSLGVIVVEAGSSSGALITAHQALDYGRLVFALPGRIDALNSKGCHALIKQGAKLTEHAEDVLSEFEYLFPASRSGHKGSPNGKQKVEMTSEQRQLMLHLQGQELTVDALIEACGLPVSQVSMLLSELEMKQWVKRLPGHQYQSLIALPLAP